LFNANPGPYRTRRSRCVRPSDITLRPEHFVHDHRQHKQPSMGSAVAAREMRRIQFGWRLLFRGGFQAFVPTRASRAKRAMPPHCPLQRNSEQRFPWPERPQHSRFHHRKQIFAVGGPVRWKLLLLCVPPVSSIHRTFLPFFLSFFSLFFFSLFPFFLLFLTDKEKSHTQPNQKTKQKQKKHQNKKKKKQTPSFCFLFCPLMLQFSSPPVQNSSSIFLE